MSRESRIQYNPALSVKENAKRNGVSEAAIRYYIKVNDIDRRFDRKQNVIEDCRKYLIKHPKATWDDVQKKTGHSLSTIRKYRRYITTETELTNFDSKKAKKRQERESASQKKLYAYLDGIPKDEILEYLARREEQEKSGMVQEKPKIEEVIILDGIPFKPYEEFHIPVCDCIQFHSKALPENKILSNHFECIITFRGYEFNGLEQLYAALNYSDSPPIIKKIMSCKSGKTAKSLCHKEYADKRDWDFEEKRYRIIALCHLFKYLSVKEYRDRLRETYPVTLVESPNGHDYHFGMVQNLDTNIFEGNNCSGRTTMIVRDRMIELENDTIKIQEKKYGRKLTPTEQEAAYQELYSRIRRKYENDKQVLADTKPLFTVLAKEGISKTRGHKPKPFSAPIIDSDTKCLVMDFDFTIFDTSADDAYRKCAGKKDMEKAFEMIPQYKLYDGWQDVFDWVKKNGVKVAVLSGASKQLIEKTFKHFNLQCETVVGYQPYIEKPNPILGNMLMERLNIRANQIILVGDSEDDDIQARSSQFRFVGATWHSGSDKDYFNERGVQTINSPIELIAIMKNAGWTNNKEIKNANTAS